MERRHLEDLAGDAFTSTSPISPGARLAKRRMRSTMPLMRWTPSTLSAITIRSSSISSDFSPERLASCSATDRCPIDLAQVRAHEGQRVAHLVSDPSGESRRGFEALGLAQEVLVAPSFGPVSQDGVEPQRLTIVPPDAVGAHLDGSAIFRAKLVQEWVTTGDQGRSESLDLGLLDADGGFRHRGPDGAP